MTEIERKSYYHLVLCQPRIPFVANMDARHDIPGREKIATVTKELEAFHPSFQVVSNGGFHTLVVHGDDVVLEDLFRFGTVTPGYEVFFPSDLIVEANLMCHSSWLRWTQQGE